MYIRDLERFALSLLEFLSLKIKKIKVNETPDRLQVKSKSGALSPQRSLSSANRGVM
jgi:hypothetical protein